MQKSLVFALSLIATCTFAVTNSSTTDQIASAANQVAAKLNQAATAVKQAANKATNNQQANNMPVTDTAANVDVKQAYVETWQANATSASAFMQLDNQSNSRVTIVAAYSPVAQETELHDFVTIKGQSVMQQVNKITINAKTDDNLKPGGFHVMLMGLRKPLTANSNVPITLVFADGSDLQVSAKVAE